MANNWIMGCPMTIILVEDKMKIPKNLTFNQSNGNHKFSFPLECTPKSPEIILENWFHFDWKKEFSPKTFQ